MKNVTSRVSGLLPVTITKWFSSPSSSNTNGSAQTGDATDSSTEDEAPESPITLQPPSKRMRFSTPNKFGYYVPTDVSLPSFFFYFKSQYDLLITQLAKEIYSKYNKVP